RPPEHVMSPVIHFLGSWMIAAASTDNSRDRKLVTLAGVIPDADGLGMVMDLANSWVSGKPNSFHYYQQYHHQLVHGWPGAIFVAIILACFARHRWRVAGLCL